MKYYNFGQTKDDWLKPQVECFLKKMKATDQKIDEYVAENKDTLIGIRFNNHLYLLDKEQVENAGFNLNNEKELSEKQADAFILNATDRKKDVYLDITTDYMTNNIVRVEAIFYNSNNSNDTNNTNIQNIAKSIMIYPEFDVTKKVSPITLKEMNMSLFEYIDNCENSQNNLDKSFIDNLKSSICVVNENVKDEDLNNFFKTNIHHVKPLDLLKAGIDNYDLELNDETLLNYMIKNSSFIYRNKREDINGETDKEITNADILSAVVRTISRNKNFEESLDELLKLCIEQEKYLKNELMAIKDGFNEMQEKEFTMEEFSGSKCDGIVAFESGFLLKNACYLSGMDDFELIDPITDVFEKGECDVEFLTENLFKKIPAFSAFKKKALEYKGDYYNYLTDPNYKKYDNVIINLMPQIAYKSFIESKVNYTEKAAENEILAKESVIAINDGCNEAAFEYKWAQTLRDFYDKKPLGASSIVKDASLTKAQQEKQEMFNLGAEKIDTTELEEIKERNKVTWKEKLANDTSKYL